MTDNVPPPQTPPNAPIGSDDSQVLEGDVKTFVMLAHGLGIFFPIIGPLIIWLVKKEQLPAIEPQCKETINFQITWFAIAILSVITCVGPAIVSLAMIVFLILATVSASNGKPYKFPWKLDLIK